MIGRFPDPFPDEVLYSVCARFSDHVQYPNKEHIFRELFGDKGVAAVVDLPCHLGHLVKNLPPGHTYTLDALIDRHTLLPFYSPFMPREHLDTIREQMITGSGKAIHRRTGITNNNVPRPAWLRYCPLCIEMDRVEVGEAYWHRLHQVPGVEICPCHLTLLENSTVRVQGSFTSKAFISAEQAVKPATSPRSAAGSSHYKILLEMATDISYLLNHPVASPGAHFFQEQYLALLARHGFVTVGGFIRAIGLLQAFTDYYPQELLALYHCEANRIHIKQNNWLATMPYRLEYARHPLRHLLLMHFLGTTTETFFHQQITRPKVFGDGPWSCLNPICDHYRELHILTCQVSEHSEKGRPVGRFTCACGFSYSRTGPDCLPEDVFRRDKILSYGIVWETKLRELWLEPTVSLNEISRRLGVSLDAVNRQAARLDLSVPRASPWPIRTGKPLHRRTKSITWYREQWLTLRNEMPEARISALRRRLPAVYSWLLRHDREWLVAHRPSSKLLRKTRPQVQMTREHQKKSLPQKNVESRDAQIAEAIRAVAYQLLNNPGPPQKVSLRRISKDIPEALALKRQPDKSPLTAQALQEVIETREAFALRRIRWVAECYRQEDILPTRSQLMIRASVYPIAEKPQVEQAIEAALRDLSYSTAVFEKIESIDEMESNNL